MNNTKHTKGPWRTGDCFCTVFGPKTNKPAPQVIASITASPFPSAEQEANARLIAASPELLAAAKQVHGRLTSWRDSHAIELNQTRNLTKKETLSNIIENYNLLIVPLQAALAKAEGVDNE